MNLYCSGRGYIQSRNTNSICFVSYEIEVPPTARLNICKKIPMNILQCTKTQNMPLQRFCAQRARSKTVQNIWNANLWIFFQVKSNLRTCQNRFFSLLTTVALIPSISSSTPFSSVWYILANTFAAFLSLRLFTSHLMVIKYTNQSFTKRQACMMMLFLYNVTLHSTCPYLGVSGRKSIPNATMNPTRTCTEREILHPKKKRSHIKLTTNPTCGQKVVTDTGISIFLPTVQLYAKLEISVEIFLCLLHEKHFKKLYVPIILRSVQRNWKIWAVLSASLEQSQQCTQAPQCRGHYKHPVCNHDISYSKKVCHHTLTQHPDHL